MSDFVAGDEPILYQVVNNGFRYITTDAPDGTESSCAEYRRADLPPTPAQIMADPRVKALVEALREYEAEIDQYIRQEYPADHPVHERYRQRDFGANPARIALAQIKEPKL